MSPNLSLTPALRQAIGRVVAQAGGAAPAGAASVAKQVGAEQLVVPRADAQKVAQELVAELGLKGIEDLARVTQADCLRCCDNPMDAMVIFALVVAIQIHCRPVEAPKGSCPLPPRKEPLDRLGVKATAGTFEDRVPERRVDPLVLIFDHVAPSTPDHPTKLWMINRSDPFDPRPIELPANTEKAKDGKYSLILGDQWMAEHGIKPGHVLELYQTKGEGRHSRSSPSTFVPINHGAPGLARSPDLPPGDIVGEVTLRPMFRTELDPAPVKLRPDQLQCSFANGVVTVQRCKDAYATEPFASVVVENLRTKETSKPATVKEDGGLHVDLAASPGDPMVLRLVDHCRTLGDPLFERRLTFAAGRDATPLLAVNPALGIDAPPSIALGRIGLTDGCRTLEADRAVTPGSIVTITRAGHDEEQVTAIADACGSFRISMPFEVHAQDVFDIVVENPFTRIEKPQDYQSRATASARLEVNCDGSLDLVSAAGRAHAADSEAGATAVAPHDNVDHVESGTPLLQDMRAAVRDFYLRFEPFNPNTGNGAGLTMSSDERAPPQASMAYDADHREVVMRLRSQIRGGWPMPSKDWHVPVGWSQFDATDNWAWRNHGVGALRQAFVGTKAGEMFSIRFENEDGQVFARAPLRVDIKIEGTGSGLGGTQQTRYVRMLADQLALT